MTLVLAQETRNAMNPPSTGSALAADSDLLPHLAAGRYAEAFERLLERFRDKVFRLAFSLLRDETQAEDMSQEIWLRIWKGLPGYHGQASLSTWIYTISRNACLTELKRRAARPTVSLQAPEMEAGIDRIPALHYNAPEGGIELDVQALVEQLPDKYRQVITLFYLEQRRYEEVASMLGVPLGTVKTFLFRAKKELLRLASRSSSPRPGRLPRSEKSAVGLANEDEAVAARRGETAPSGAHGATCPTLRSGSTRPDPATNQGPFPGENR